MGTVAFFKEFRYGDGVLYGAMTPLIKFWVDPLIDSGGAVRGALSVNWDVSQMEDWKGVMVVARPMRPALVPEEGDTLYLEWGEPKGSLEFRSGSSKWHYLSLFCLGNDNFWYLVAYNCAIPVADWQYGDVVIPSLLPGIVLVTDGGYASARDDESAMSGVLHEIGSVFDEVKTSAEALVPFWDHNNMVPQATPAVAWLLGLDYQHELGAGVYQDLFGLPSYGDTTLDSLGEKTAACLRWVVRPRASRNHMRDNDDSSAEWTVGGWKKADKSQPLRVAYGDTTHLDPVGVSRMGHFRFPEGTWDCGDQKTGYLFSGPWPSAYGGMFIRLSPGTTATGDVTLGLTTYAHSSDTSGTEVPLLTCTPTSTWTWVTSSRRVGLNTDNYAVPRLKVPAGVKVDVDCIFIGPGTYSSRKIVPQLEVWPILDNGPHTRAGLMMFNTPEHGTASIHWGEEFDGDARSRTQEIPWVDFKDSNGDYAVFTHDYMDSDPDETRYTVVVKDVQDDNVYAVATVVIPGVLG